MSMRVAEKNLLRSAASPAGSSRVKAHMAWLERTLDDLDQSLRQTFGQSPVRRE